MKNVTPTSKTLLFISTLLAVSLLSCNKKEKEEEYKRIYPSYFVKFFDGGDSSPAIQKELWDVVEIYEQNQSIRRVEAYYISTIRANDTIIVYCANCTNARYLRFFRE